MKIKTKRRAMSIFLCAVIIVSCAVNSFAAGVASGEYFSSRSDTKIERIAYTSYIYKRSIALYSQDHPHYLRAQMKTRILKKVVTDSGRIYSNKANTVYSPYALDYVSSAESTGVSSVKAYAWWDKA